MKHLRSIIILVILIAFGTFIHAESIYRILFLNTPTITINGKLLRKGDTFRGSDIIKWENEKQAMKVLNINTKQQSIIVSQQYTKSKAKSFEEYFVHAQNMSVRNAGTGTPIELKALLDNTFYLLDTLMIETMFKTDEHHYFFISYDYNGEQINKRIHCDNGSFSITPEIFQIDGNPIKPFDTMLRVFYHDTDSGKLTLITDKMKMIFIGNESN